MGTDAVDNDSFSSQKVPAYQIPRAFNQTRIIQPHIKIPINNKNISATHKIIYKQEESSHTPHTYKQAGQINSIK
jgi:hypothetical protein